MDRYSFLFPVHREHRKKRALIAWGDGLFLAFVMLFAFLAYQGALALSSDGICIDSDLATYAQGMAGAAKPAFFFGDPIVATPTQANSIPNAERMLASLLTPGDAYAIGLLRACAIILVVYFVSWYVFGRWLFHERLAAILLVALVSITVWVGFGTFWGITHSDPVPRVFHAALWPWMLMLAILGFRHVALRPLALFCAGLGMWLHGVSALNTGAMIFCAFFFHRPKTCSLGRHGRVLGFSLLAFFVPVLLFLWPSLSQGQSFTPEQLEILAQAFMIRWHEDYGNIPGTLLSLVLPWNPIAYIGYAGLLATLWCRFYPNDRLRDLSRMMPAFFFAMCCVILFSLLETRYAADFGRIPMGHELVRGVKFFVPLFWIMICAFLVYFLKFLPKKGSTALVGLCIVSILVFSQDKQHIAAQYAIAAQTGIQLPLAEEGQRMAYAADLAREAVMAVHERITPGDRAFCLEDSMMALRYAGFCPLAYSFKDGYAFFYNKDYASMHEWMTITKAVAKGEEGIRDAIAMTKARWYLARQSSHFGFEDTLTKVWENEAWKLYRVLP